MSEAALIAISPDSILVLRLSRRSPCRTAFLVKNTSRHKIAFKVKTTQPSFYYVRPNQSVLDVGQSEEVVIVLVEGETNRIMDDYLASGITENLEKHRFLVLSMIIDNPAYDKVMQSNSQERQDEFVKLWGGTNKDNRKSCKLNLEYDYSGVTANVEDDQQQQQQNSDENYQPHQQQPQSANRRVTPVHMEDYNSNEYNNDNKNNNRRGGKSSSPSSDSNNNPSYDALKQQYDAVVEYTVHLTAERDMIMKQLEVLKREYNNEVNRSKQAHIQQNKQNENNRGISNETTGKSNNNTNESAVANTNVNVKQGFSFLVVIVMGVIAFLLGRYAI